MDNSNNMKSICLFFQVHQPFLHRRYRFFDIGNDHYYYNDYANETTIRKVVENSYLPTNKLFLKLANKLEGKFKVAFSISGVALEQLELYAPELIKSFQELAKTGCVEFLSETYAHSLAALKDESIFKEQVEKHSNKICELFGHKPQVFRNTEMIYSDEIGRQIADMGYSAVLTEGAKHVLGWKSPNFVYVNAINPRLKVLMRNSKLSDDLAFRFSDENWEEYPLTSDKFISWLENLDDNEEIINLFLSYESLGGQQIKTKDIIEFIESFSAKAVKSKHLMFTTPSEAVEQLQPISMVNVPHPVSWVDEERDLTPWLGNGMQKEAYEKLYALKPQMQKCTNQSLIKDWNYLQTSDHFYYMSTKYLSDGVKYKSLNPFDSPYEAFINYMNVLSDFKIRLNTLLPESKVENEIAALHKLVEDKEQKIKKLEADLLRLQKANKRKKSTAKK